MSTNRLILMRHAKSAWDTDARTDFDRPLSRRGQKDAPQMGTWLAGKNLVPDKIISSPACRARQTALLASKSLGIEDKDIVWVEKLYESSLPDLLAAIETNSDGLSCMLLISHNPGLDQLLCHLCRDEMRLTDSGKLMTTAAIAVLSFGDSGISTVAGSAALEVLIRPKELVDGR